MGAIPPSSILSRKGIARYGGVSRTGPLSPPNLHLHLHLLIVSALLRWSKFSCRATVAAPKLALPLQNLFQMQFCPNLHFRLRLLFLREVKM